MIFNDLRMRVDAFTLMMMNYKEELAMTEREYFDAVEKIINKALAAGMTLDEICEKLGITTDG